ncbi:hypothetical protein ACFXHA_44335 [Nocardia sp. NPDC059240]|uniref:hypothetical protein n=1 Tax=Nocardia sp. NPDC059240 TaxID=3346786 RepID=UPI0036A03586
MKEPTIDIAKLPLCGDVKDAGIGLPTDCKLISRDSAGYTFVVRHAGLERTSAGGNTRVVLVDVVTKDLVDNSDYVTDRTMVETGSGMMFGEPMLRDIDADGRDEVLIPVGSGTGGVTDAIYRDTPLTPGSKSAHFVKIGEINGIDLEHTDSGYIATVGKGGAAEKEVSFMKIENSQLREMVRVEIDLSENSSGHVQGTCKVINSSGLAGSGLSDSEVTQRFCSEPIVLKYK